MSNGGKGFFTLSGSTTSQPSLHSSHCTTSYSSGIKFVDRSTLELLPQPRPLSHDQTMNSGENQGSSNNSMRPNDQMAHVPKSFNSSTKGITSGPNSVAGNLANSNIQQALLQSMASRQQSRTNTLFADNRSVSNISNASSASGGAGAQGVHSTMPGLSSVASVTNGSAHGNSLSSSQVNLVQQVFGNMGGTNSNANNPPTHSRQPSHNNIPQQHGQGSMISQLVASLQSQQQAQQQAQVQAALARAFGPSAGGSAGFSSQVGAPSHSFAAPSSSSAQDLLSRMQLAQAVQNVASKVGGVGSARIAHQPPTGAPVSTDVTKAGADDLIKLQLEQERHNRMIQMAQADRQERAMLANQEALLRKQQRMMKKTNGLGDSKAATLNRAVNDVTSNHIGMFPSVAAFQSPLLGNAASSLGTKLPGLVNPPKSSAAPGSEPELRRKLGGAASGAVIVPCRARGMNVDHNFKTAYFVIPEGIEHGDELMCSYPSCRQAGVKFRYCLHCKVPVAKRNFRNRHRHGVPGGDGESVSDEECDEEDVSSDDDGEEESEVKDETFPRDKINSTAMDSNLSICLPASGGPPLGPVSKDGSKKEHMIVIPSCKDVKKKKKSGNIRVPCRARGMPMAHNFKTAYFIIPPNIQHGDELVCSFPSCRSAGAKFRYCLHCKVPVAKRNFRNRHKHGNIGGMDKKKAAKTQDSQTEKAKETSEVGVPQQTNNLTSDQIVKEGVEGDNLKEAMSRDENTTSQIALEPGKSEADCIEDSTEANDLNLDKAACVGPAASVEEASSAKSAVAVNSSMDADKVQKWVSLLESKPDASDKQAMALWMLNLMSATEDSATGNQAANGSENCSKRHSVGDDSGNDEKSSSQPPKKKFKTEWEEV